MKGMLSTWRHSAPSLYAKSPGRKRVCRVRTSYSSTDHQRSTSTPRTESSRRVAMSPAGKVTGCGVSVSAIRGAPTHRARPCSGRTAQHHLLSGRGLGDLKSTTLAGHQRPQNPGLALAKTELWTPFCICNQALCSTCSARSKVTAKRVITV